MVGVISLVWSDSTVLPRQHNLWSCLPELCLFKGTKNNVIRVHKETPTVGRNGTDQDMITSDVKPGICIYLYYHQYLVMNYEAFDNTIVASNNKWLAATFKVGCLMRLQAA